jgi:serine protease Do
MSNDNSNKDEKTYSFIQEQIVSKKKFKLRRMFYSVTWTIVLACIFGIVAGTVFCISEPAINRILGKPQNKKTVEFPATTDETIDSTEETKEQTSEAKNNTENGTVNTNTADNSKDEKADETAKKPDTLVIEKYIKGNVQDLNNIYLELREIAQEVDKSILNVTSISSGVDMLMNNEYEADKISSGLVVANNGEELFILVSYDRVQDAKTIQVELTDSISVKAKLQDYDSDLNLAILSVSLKNIPDLVLESIKPANLGDSYSLTVGTPILALGSPNGYVDSVEFGMINGKGSVKYITDNKIELFNTDIWDNDNSDGVIVNLRGEVIGIITQKLKDEYNGNVNTAIGISQIKDIIESMVNKRDRSYFGIKGADMNEAALTQAGVENGICVIEVESDSPALAAGLQNGDIITQINDTKILSVKTFYSIVSSSAPKDIMKVTIMRNENDTFNQMELEVTLGKKGGK